MKETEFYLNRVTQTDYRGGFKKKEGIKSEEFVLNLNIKKSEKILSETEILRLKDKIENIITLILSNTLPEERHSLFKKSKVLEDLELNFIWEENSESIVNRIKIELLREHIEEILVFFKVKIQNIVRRYTRNLPSFVVESEIDDLRTIAQLEFIETFKVWHPERNDSIWPLAQMRIIGAMKDHMRFITKSDPARLYDWITDAAYIYEAVNSSANFENKYETGDQLAKVMEVLDERERKVVVAHAQSDMTFKIIGENIGISESQISRIYKKAIEKMKKELKKQSND